MRRSSKASDAGWEAVEYQADPDFLAIIEVYRPSAGNHDPGEVQLIEVGVGYKNPKGGGAVLQLYSDERSKQLIYESGSIKMTPFRRTRPTDPRAPKKGLAPRVAYRPASI